MKLLRYGMSANGASSGNIKPGMLDEKGVIRDLSGMVTVSYTHLTLPTIA